MDRSFRYVPNAVVRELLTPSRANELAEETLLDHANGLIDWASPRQMDLFPSDAGTQYKVKGCVLKRHGVAGFRVVGLNRAPIGQRIMAERPTKNVLLSDASTSAFFGIVDERWGYGMRTGACGAVAIKHLARPGDTRAAVFGTGHMAYASILTLTAAVPLERISVWSRDAERRSAFAARMTGETGVEVVPADSPEAALKDAPIVVAMTPGMDPLLKKEWFVPGATVYVGGGSQEVEDRCYKEMTFMGDDRAQIRITSDIMHLIDAHGYDDSWVAADLAQVVSGQYAGRQSDDEQILIRSQGLVTQDVAQALWLYEEAERQDAGVSLEHALPEGPGTPLY
jgi:alanine dehydrogenase